MRKFFTAENTKGYSEEQPAFSLVSLPSAKRIWTAIALLMALIITGIFTQY